MNPLVCDENGHSHEFMSGPTRFQNFQVRMTRIRIHSTLRHPAIRGLFEEKLHPSQLVFPVFVSGYRKEDRYIPGFEQKGSPVGNLRQYGYGNDYSTLISDCLRLQDMGLRHIMLFGVVDEKDHLGKLADHMHDCPVIGALRAIRSERALANVSLMTDVCLCEYTDHGHCGILKPGTADVIDNDLSIHRLAKVARSYAEAGADVVVPSDMMDGRIAAIRDELNGSGNSHVSILAHSSKKASVLYSPFRSAVESTFTGNRKQYQQPVGSSTIAMRSMRRDIQEGADMIMVKPSLMYGDLISKFKAESPTTPVAAYVVSGEYKMLHDYGVATDSLQEIVRESHLSLVRAGASILVTYFTPMILNDIHKWSDMS
jgi:porphobilinogen synthase